MCANGLTVKVTTVETQLVTAIRDRVFSSGAIQYLVEKVNALMTSSGDAQEDGYRQVEGELLQVEHELKNIEKAILAGVVGETTGVLLRDREANAMHSDNKWSDGSNENKCHRTSRSVQKPFGRALRGWTHCFAAIRAGSMPFSEIT